MSSAMGGGLNQHNANGGVDLKTPEITIRIEVKDEQVLSWKTNIRASAVFPLVRKKMCYHWYRAVLTPLSRVFNAFAEG